MGMEYKLQREGEHLTVKVSGRLDANSSPDLEDGLAPALVGITDMTFDLAELEYISSAGLRILLASFKLMAKRGGEMRIENATGDVTDVLEISGFAEVFDCK